MGRVAHERVEGGGDVGPDRARSAVVRSIRSRVSIREAARICNLTARAIRFYEARGLIVSMRDAGGIRIYDDETLASLGYIARARRAGLTVRDILELVELRAREGRQAQIARQREICRSHLQVLEQRRGELERFMSPQGDMVQAV